MREILRGTPGSRKPEVLRKSMMWAPGADRDGASIDVLRFFELALDRFAYHSPALELASTSDQA